MRYKKSNQNIKSMLKDMIFGHLQEDLVIIL